MHRHTSPWRIMIWGEITHADCSHKKIPRTDSSVDNTQTFAMLYARISLSL